MFRGYYLLGLAALIMVSVSSCSSKPLSDPADQQPIQFKDTQSLTNELVGDSAEGTNNYTFLRINHYKAECEGFFVSFCFRVQEANSDVWQYLYDEIEGFDYQWGNTYEILVSKESQQLGLADAPQTKYLLQEVLSTTPHDVTLPFTATSRKPHERITEIEPGTFSYLNRVNFTCSQSVCGALRSAIDQKQSVLLSFQHGTQSNSALVLNTVLCADAPKSFVASCL